MPRRKTVSSLMGQRSKAQGKRGGAAALRDVAQSVEIFGEPKQRDELPKVGHVLRWERWDNGLAAELRANPIQNSGRMAQFLGFHLRT